MRDGLLMQYIIVTVLKCIKGLIMTRS